MNFKVQHLVFAIAILVAGLPMCGAGGAKAQGKEIFRFDTFGDE
jgi:hypothetical protein